MKHHLHIEQLWRLLSELPMWPVFYWSKSRVSGKHIDNDSHRDKGVE
jgi:hypothetical protein